MPCLAYSVISEAQQPGSLFYPVNCYILTHTEYLEECCDSQLFEANGFSKGDQSMNLHLYLF